MGKKYHPMSIGHSTAGESTVTESVIPDGMPLNAPVDIHPALEDVRAMREFQPEEQGWLDHLLNHPAVRQVGERLEGVLQGVLEALNRLLSQVTPPELNHLPQSMLSLFSGFIGFILILMGLYVFYMLLTYVLHMQERRVKPPAQEARTFDQTLLVSAAHHKQQAADHARSGQFDEAVRQLFLAALCLLDETAMVPFEWTRTNREYLEALAPEPTRPLQGPFRELSRMFEAVRYGNRHADAGQYAACEARMQELETEGARHGG